MNVRFTPKSGHRNSAARCPLCAISRHSLNDVVGNGEKSRRYRKAERLRGPQVDYKIGLRGLQDRQIVRFGTFEDLGCVERDLPICVYNIDTIANEPTRKSVFAKLVNCRH